MPKKVYQISNNLEYTSVNTKAAFVSFGTTHWIQIDNIWLYRTCTLV